MKIGKFLRMTISGKPIRTTGSWKLSTGIAWEDPFSREEEKFAEDILILTTDTRKEDWRDAFNFCFHLCTDIEGGTFV